MNDNEIFMKVDEIGDLYLYDVLLSYIYPRVFVCEDTFGSKYIFYEVISKDNTDAWIVARITKKEYYSLVDRKKAIQKVYKKKKGFNLFSIYKYYDVKKDTTQLSLDVKELIKKLPKEPVFAEKEIIDDVAKETLDVARKTGHTTFDIRLFAGTDRHFVPQNIMSNLCSAMASLTRSISDRKRNEVLRVATAPGSCVVRFSFPEQINLFNENDAANEVDIINNVLSSEHFIDKLENIKDQTKFIKSYSKILDCVRKTNSDVQFTTASPNSTEVRKIELSRENIKKRYDDVKDVYKVEEFNEKYNGTLVALDVKNKKFKFQLIDGAIKSGVIADDFLMKGSFEIPKKYEAEINIKRLFNASDSGYIDKYFLKDLSV